MDPTAGQRTDYGLKCPLYPGADGLHAAMPDEYVVNALSRARAA